jgi:hypothetical protein
MDSKVLNMSIIRLKDVDMSSTWTWFGEMTECTLGTHNGQFVDGNIVVKIMNDDGQKLKVNLYIQDVEVLEVIQPPTIAELRKQKLLKLLDDVFGFLDDIADGAKDTEDYDETERMWAQNRDSIHEAWKIAENMEFTTEHVKQKRDG